MLPSEGRPMFQAGTGCMVLPAISNAHLPILATVRTVFSAGSSFHFSLCFCRHGLFPVSAFLLWVFHAVLARSPCRLMNYTAKAFTSFQRAFCSAPPGSRCRMPFNRPWGLCGLMPIAGTWRMPLWPTSRGCRPPLRRHRRRCPGCLSLHRRVSPHMRLYR